MLVNKTSISHWGGDEKSYHLVVGEEKGNFSYELGNVMGRGSPWDGGGLRAGVSLLLSLRGRCESPRLGSS